MCLIIAGQAVKIRNALLNTENMLLDIFRSNPDGIGIMYATKNKLKIVKRLPKSLDEARTFIERMPQDTRQLAIHFRWTTHGDTNLENCHPYTVVPNEVALMHNGVLATGNAADKSKSDTWHFINDYLKESVALAPGIVFDPGYIALVKDFIGISNRFVFMGSDGRMTIVNKKEGIEHDGLWFSNTYAWRPGVFIANYKSGWNNGTYYQPTRNRGSSYQQTYGGPRYGNGYMGMDDDDDYGVWAGSRGSNWQNSAGGTQSGGTKSGVTHNTPALPPASAPAPAPAQPSAYTQADAEADAEWERTVRKSHEEWLRDQRSTAPQLRFAGGTRQVIQDEPEESGEARGASEDASLSGPPQRGELIEALTDANVEVFEAWLTDFPQVTLGLLFHLYKATPTRWTQPKDLSAYERGVYNSCLDADKATLISECRREDGSVSAVAEVICYYLNWLAWPEVTSDVKRTAREVVDTSQQAFNVQASNAETSSAQTGQGGDADRDGYAESTVYLQ